MSSFATLAQTSRVRYAHSEPQHSGYFDRSNVTGAGFARCAGEAPVLECGLIRNFDRCGAGNSKVPILMTPARLGLHHQRLSSDQEVAQLLRAQTPRPTPDHRRSARSNEHRPPLRLNPPPRTSRLVAKSRAL